MKKIILLSGHSDRFKQVGLPIKPLLEIDENLFAIDYTVSMMSSCYTDLIFVTKLSDNLNDWLLNRYKGASVVTTTDHRDGPAVSLLNVMTDLSRICQNDTLLISYCDLFINDNICNIQFNNDIDGALITHTGFHPHTLYNKSFAHLKHENNKVVEVKEKGCYTANQLEEPASSGIYYFKSITLLKKYIEKQINANERVNNEFYLTMTYNYMIKDMLNVILHPVDNYISFGVPNDYYLFKYYYNTFKRLN